MEAFDSDADLSEDVAFRLMRNTFVTLFWRPAILADATSWLAAHGYHVTRLDASRWQAEADLHRDMAQALEFPGYYGHNLDALNDCMRDVVDHRYGWAVGTAGLAVVFTGYDRFAGRCPRAAQIVLDIMARQGRSALLLGHRLMCLVQTDDPQTSFEPVGAMPVMWNEAEWLDAARRPNAP